MLGSFIAKTATRAGIVLWVKPFQNMRSTRATELIEIYPAHIVNAWLGHTEAVAMAHYRQTTGKAVEKYFEQAAGMGEIPGTNAGAKTVQESDGIGCFGVEVENSDIAATSCIPITCNAAHNSLQDKDLCQVTRQGLEP